MKAHLRYLRYVLRHKWFVFRAGRQLGTPLYQLLIHDWSKFTPSEWTPYVETFYGDKPSPRDASGAYDPTNVSTAFDYAWLSHQHRNPHHWQYWVLPKDDGSEKILAMPHRYRLEMLADWKGAGRAIHGENADARAWYLANRDKMRLHPETRAWVEKQFGVDGD